MIDKNRREKRVKGGQDDCKNKIHVVKKYVKTSDIGDN